MHSEGSEAAFLDAFVLAPGVIAGQVDVIPMDRCNVRQQCVVDRVAALTQCHHGAIQINRIPEDDRRGDQVEPGGAMALAFIGPIADFTEPVKAHRASQVIAQLALIQDSSHSAPQLRVEQPVEHEQRPLDSTELA